jgi:hypothetical protein
MPHGPYDEALTALHQAPLASFVTERNRLAAALRTKGDKAGSLALAKRRRPSASAWTVNQLWWQARPAFEAMLASAKRLRSGDLGAADAHREATATLRRRAAGILADAKHGATEATLRRVTTTLSAIAAAGGFEPDAPGTLATDRDPPGFEAFASAEALTGHRAPSPTKRAKAEDKRTREAFERRRQEAELARRRAERTRLHDELRVARDDLEKRERDLAAIERNLANARSAVTVAKRAIKDIERALEDVEGE